MFVIGTAGHVDHGKSTLVEKLTGVDPDRLREEKDRGMTIDLGFAWLQLPNGNEVSVVDVPGHERFVNNMLAGVGSINLALLIIAADESIMPQTREHLAILDLLQVKKGIVAITKSDLVDNEWMDIVKAEAEDVLEETTLEGSPIIPVSSLTGDGLTELVEAIEARLSKIEINKDLGRPRLTDDRSFTMPRIGTIVTCTLIDGWLQAGQNVELVPKRQNTRIRGLQSHKRKVEKIGPGNRVAANLAGVRQSEVARGDIITIPNWLEPSIAMDVRLKVIPGSPRPIRHNMFATIHIGSSEAIGRIRLLEKSRVAPGDSTWAQIKFDQPQPVVKDDYFVVRSNHATLGGGRVVDSHARRHRRNYTPVLDRLKVIEQGSDRAVLIKCIETLEPAEFEELTRRANMSPVTVKTELRQLEIENLIVTLSEVSINPGTMVFSTSGWAKLSAKSQEFLEDFHYQFPLRKGAPKEELRSRLGMKAPVFSRVLMRLKADGILVEEGPDVRKHDHVQVVSEAQQKSIDSYMKLLSISPYSPPTDNAIDPELISLLVQEGKVIKVSDTIIFETSAYEKMVSAIKSRIGEAGELTVADVRDMFGASRKYSLALMNYLDQQKITKRIGDSRVLR